MDLDLPGFSKTLAKFRKNRRAGFLWLQLQKIEKATVATAMLSKDNVRYLDFGSWQGAITTLLGLAVVALVGVGVRVLMMLTIQQRRERMNRQINERLKTLIAAYKTLGGSFTGQLMVDPTHLRDLRATALEEEQGIDVLAGNKTSDRSRRTRDSVEAALSDIILLGTAEQVRLAAQAAGELVGGRPIHTADLVVSLRNFIRTALDLEPTPADANIPIQGPTRAQGSSSRGKGNGDNAGDKGSARGADLGAAGGGGLGMGVGHGAGQRDNDPDR